MFPRFVIGDGGFGNHRKLGNLETSAIPAGGNLHMWNGAAIEKADK